MACCAEDRTCYWGCGTRRNKLLWLLVAVFAALYIAFQIAFSVEWNKCEVCNEDGSDCMGIADFMFSDRSSDRFATLECNGDDKCTRNGDAGRVVKGCDTVVVEVLNWLAFLFFVVMFVPCCVMCCCSQKPDSQDTAVPTAAASPAAATPYVSEATSAADADAIKDAAAAEAKD